MLIPFSVVGLSLNFSIVISSAGLFSRSASLLQIVSLLYMSLSLLVLLDLILLVMVLLLRFFFVVVSWLGFSVNVPASGR